VQGSLDLLVDGEQGVWHLANEGEISWYALACLAAETAGLRPERVRPGTPQELGWVAPRPKYSALGSERGHLLPRLESAVERYWLAVRG
jgi:dTDP-4-dehydrorhamnose reductase